MSLFVLAQFKIHDRAGYDDYVALATPIFIREKVKILASDDSPVAITPGADFDKVVLLEFRDQAHMTGFFSAPDYMKAADIRNAASTLTAMQFNRFEMPSA